ncbi:endolytic transglycosylase MltG [Modicisalibacter tunisiensis]|uniref:Endolytic murein transglycosylase n=1 Tax=Modicisalibacter tunisiensis TaxID=390637 RepID=A0ABS7X1A0_9GAMM|nr:endolytic transglycosylase MltG [Modicisalibacter tunisiensis]MBZ9568682.1 endolytic transglycosylase MltG [Modicisalibacter tunisiensis]
MRWLKLCLAALAVLGLVAYGAFRYWQSQLVQPLAIEQSMLYEVPQGAGFDRVVDDLVSRGVLAEAWPFKLAKRFRPAAWPALRAGEFRLEPGMSGRAALERLGSDQVVTYTVTFPEGWTFHQVREALDDAVKLKHTLEGLDDSEVMARLGHPDQHPEGRFFPDTYRYHKGVSDKAILARAYARMQSSLDEVWSERDADLPLKSPYQALILASLIERETGADGERARIAGVFVRRLEKGMRLQTDPSVIYGLGDDYDGNITRADLQRKTPYNTYVIDGLPPTPIAMPGMAALRAAVHPADGDALYFVAKGDGSHHFSATLREHNAAVRRYILNR